MRVLELGSTVAGPFCGRLLADFGAEVIKVEAAEGDTVRSMGKRLDGRSLYAASIFRNKELISVDLRLPEGQEVVRKLVALLRRGGGEFSPRRAGAMEPRLRRSVEDQPKADHGSHQRFWADRSLFRASRLWRDRRSAERLAPHHRRSRSSAGARRDVADRLHHRTLRRVRRRDGDPGAAPDRSRPGDRHRVVRVGVLVHGAAYLGV